MAKQSITREHEFETHKHGCKQCASIEIERPATLVNCCLAGAPLLRDFLNAISAPAMRKQMAALKRQFTQDAEGKTHCTTKQKLKEVMRYKA
jgi:GrpB-like predicted nucleotidyltransferase (UPF0157 family)